MHGSRVLEWVTSLDFLCLENGWQGAEKDVQIEPDRPVFYVLKVMLYTLFDLFQGVGFATETIDLRPASDAGLNPMTSGVLFYSLLKSQAGCFCSGCMRARSDHRHAPPQNVK